MPSINKILFNLVLILVVPQQKGTDPVEESAIPSSSKPIPASAILTFIPDNEVKKIVTRPQVENNNGPGSDKQMVLRERRTAGQDSPYNRKRPALPHSETDGEVKSVCATGVDPDGVLSASSSGGNDADLVEEGALVKESPDVMSKVEEKDGMEVSASSVESGKESKIPSVPENTVKKEDQELSSESKDNVLLDSNSDDKMEVESSAAKNQVGESDLKPKISVTQNRISAQASSVSKTELPSSSLADSSKTLPVSSALVVKDTKPVAISSVGHQTQPSAVDDDIPAVEQAEQEPVFRLGSEANYSSYINQFTSNPLALTKQQQLEQRDKKRSVSHKFSLIDFKWHGDTCGSKDIILNTLRFSIVGLENSIATSFMHPSWPVQRSTWVRAVHLSKTPKEFAAALSFLESSIRPICYLPVWNDAVGHVELHRVMSEAKQTGTKKKDHKEEEEEPELEHKGFGAYILFFFSYAMGDTVA